ncbi:FAD-dependent oxidoreductase [Parasporobacterium paucivorans]|uniref:Prolycopene isomerase n=1 Tax=Parasporobacterium paucivorans DSM 15970 TaxID=1122934 RepID=A0A1M6GKJ7_9FIRM|nr:FAD-dependent oxidoreductase [Parasporobacterium paucivorans]SHJ10454.1 prolycopene isomerase [Parasporobacterium paucivorans DSM 15970]
MRYDTVIIGGGLSGLTAGALLSKRGIKVGVVDKSYNPGGSCGIFKRDGKIFDQGASMLYGFGEKGFNAHRFVFNCLEEPIDVIKHDLLYCVNFKGHKIHFWPDLDMFSRELAEVFPLEKENIVRFYKEMEKMYHHVMVENPNYTTPDETDKIASLKGFLKHPLSYARFLTYLNKSAKSLLEKYFTDPEIFKFFNKLTSTYCYSTVEESPAVLAAVMFVDNHIGGSYYPAGSTLFLPGKLEKVIEENGGQMLLEKEVVKILFQNDRPAGVRLKDGEAIYADNLIYSGDVWNLYGKLIDDSHSTRERRDWARNLVPTYPSIVLYAEVGKDVIPEDTQPVEMLVGNPDELDESEVTVYICSIDDKTLCPPDRHVAVAIGPTLEDWRMESREEYQNKKEKEKDRLLSVMEKRFPGFSKAVYHAEVATPRTIERYTNKYRGSVAGPKQMLGQHMFKRLHTRSEWDNLFFCGESTVMGTGTPTVTTSGLSAANALLRKSGMKPFTYNPDMKSFVNILDKPVTKESLYSGYSEIEKSIMHRASACEYCEHPACIGIHEADIRGIMRRVTVGNFTGAKRIASAVREKGVSLEECEERCIRNMKYGTPVSIGEVLHYLADDGRSVL